jgi:AbrB family looped-hinge helix DNA binding protein
MKVSRTGQITIPKKIRYQMGIKPGVELAFIIKKGKLFLEIDEKASMENYRKKIEKVIGISKLKMTTDEVMKMFRG